MTAVDTLRRNDPTETVIVIFLFRETSDADLAAALVRNTFIKQIRIYFGDRLQQFDWPLLVRAILARENLTDLLELHTNSAPAEALILQLLDAAHSNANIIKIKFDSFTFVLGSDLFSYLCTHFSAPVLVLRNCDMAAPAQCEPGARALTANTAIETLDLSITTFRANGMHSFLTAAIVRNLVTNTHVKTLRTEFRGPFLDDDCCSAIGRLMETTTTLEQFELEQNVGRMIGEKFTPIARGLINSASVCNFNVSSTHFNDGGTRVFQEILDDKQNLASLSLNNVTFGEDNRSRPAVLDSVATALSLPNSRMRCFEYETNLAILSHPLDDNSLWTLLRAVAKSKLHRFKIGTLNSQIQMQSLAEIVPLLRLQELEISFCPPLDERTVTRAMLVAVKKNFSMRSVKGFDQGPNRLWREPVFTQVEVQRRLAFYFNRNERLDDWVDSVERLDRKLWPNALELAEQAGRDTLFTSLQSVLGSDYVKLRNSGRKRKRTYS